MPKFLVRLGRIVTEYLDVTVECASEEDLEDRLSEVYDKVRQFEAQGRQFDWDQEDDNPMSIIEDENPTIYEEDESEGEATIVLKPEEN